ncbi:hypothetical protein PACTADRAFT_42750 [Pachysolen tannophilus NRRL Y-2460]|uniref:Fatty acid synthase subunit alpha n=1 Tax=Pachysolen tannophilus NRRL Y-2460 TaxID=669874 RepID=A0A1E4TV48_PACTA|nr:hypothetical protein PACTADRAFT_42750 [Pachysolen tannophilus NRRL Y-2460]
MRPEIEQELSHVLLTELLAYQFASPVRWIETQDVFLKDHNTERVVEIGPSPTLAGMASRTIKAKYESYDAALSLQRQVLTYSKDTKEIYYKPDPADLVPEETPVVTAASSVAAPAASSAPAPAVSAAPAPSGPVAQIPDEPVPASLILHVLVAHKLKKPLDAVPMSKAIKDLVGGKSTVQNEILGDLGKEFGSTPEKPEDTPLQELAEQFQDSFNGSLGKQTSSLIARLMSSKMPGGFSVTSARKYLESRGLGPGRQDAALLLSLTLEPAKRLGSEPEAREFLDKVIGSYEKFAGVSLASSAASSGAGAGAAAGAVIDSAQFEEMTKDQRVMARDQLEVLAKYLKMDLSADARKVIKEQEATKILQAELDLFNAEHGDYYMSGIVPSFSPLKARIYDSSWNWARQDAIEMFFEIINDKLSTVDRETVARCINIMNRANPTLIQFMQYRIDECPADRGETYQLAKKLGQQLIENCKQVINSKPVYKDISYPTAPKTTVDSRGNVKYEEVVDPKIRKLSDYVYKVAQGSELTKVKQPSIKEELAKVYKSLSKDASTKSKEEIDALFKKIFEFAKHEVDEAPILVRSDLTTSSISNDEIASLTSKSDKKVEVAENVIPFLHIQTQDGEKFAYNKEITQLYLETLENAATNGVSFTDKTVLITGAGLGSIGAEVLKGLLMGGAKVVVTTSRFSKKVTEHYQSMYSKYGGSGSCLVVVPFNQGSKQDVEALISYIYDDAKKGGLGWDLDAIIPFAAIPENGIELENIDSKSTLAQRIMLQNVLRLLGCIKKNKTSRKIKTRPCQVVLPLSPNHGTFGGDGLYSESKIALETLFNKFHSENWKDELSITGAVIGWTRGTGLMSANNIIAEKIESYKVKTFSQMEMSFNILGLIDNKISNLAQTTPLLADLNGGLQHIANLKEITAQARQEIVSKSEIKQAVHKDHSIDVRTINGENSETPYLKHSITKYSNNKYAFPTLKPYSAIKSNELEGLLDLEKVIVVTGFAEVGPWGSARTRWEMEAYGHFSLEGCIEMAWIMGKIKHHSGNLKGKPYSGWVDAKTNEPVADKDVKKKYEEEIISHSGIRMIEPELFNNYNPNHKKFIQEVVLEKEMTFVSSEETARMFKLEHKDLCFISKIEGSDEYDVKLMKGTTLFVPKALKFDRLVAGQIPTGWNAATYGVSQDIIDQVDPVTLYVLVATAEALISSGITDPYEFYKYVHVSEVGNCSGSGMGGVSALRGMFKDRYQDKPVQNDILQESFINTMSAWVNMLLLSSSGPIKTPVGACATAVESVDIGVETILSGKAKICLVGGYDDFQEEGSYEFANMNATSNSLEEAKKGRTPSEMSRPATTTRSGFMESQGSGIQVIMTADIALKMGVPIYAIVALTNTATDKISRSVPAPGKGILTVAREVPGNGTKNPKLDIKYRKRLLEQRKRQIKLFVDSEIEIAREEAGDDKALLQELLEQVNESAVKQLKQAQHELGNEFWKNDPKIAPLRGALATFNLTIDDLGVASFHGTSTKANDKNESDAINSMLSHLGRTPGNAIYGVFQKYLTGHPKGAAGAWMLNGAIQILLSGIVPGNRNADNIDKIMEQFKYILYPSRSIQTDGIKAVSVTSFGFGQKGAQAVVIHPDYLYASLDQGTYEEYAKRVAVRYNKTYKYMHNAVLHNSLFVAKDKSPYSDELEKPVYLNPLARVDTVKGELEKLEFTKKSVEAKKAISDNLSSMTKNLAGQKGVGVDVELLSAVNISNETFVERNFTEAEISYCSSAPSPQSSFTGTWSAKEAVFKALGVKSQGGGASLKDIEILRDSNGAPKVLLSGSAAVAASEAGVKSIKVSISHDDAQAVAVAISEF